MSDREEQKEINIERWGLWQRNVQDRFKDTPTEDIKSEMKRTSFPFSVCFENWQGDFNMATGIRNANAFNTREVFYLGNRKFDKRGAVGTYHYLDVTHLSSLEELRSMKDRYTLVGIDNVVGSVPITNYKYPENPMFIFGEEGVGITADTLSLCTDIVEIPMYGSVRSLNCGTSSGIVMYDYTSKF